MMEMSYRCCCAAAGMVFLPHSTRLHPSHVPSCSVGARSTKFDMLPLTVCALSATVMTGRQCCRHVGTASAACSANVPHLRTTLWTSLLGCGVLLRSLSNQTPRSTCAGPVGRARRHILLDDWCPFGVAVHMPSDPGGYESQVFRRGSLLQHSHLGLVLGHAHTLRVHCLRLGALEAGRDRAGSSAH